MAKPNLIIAGCQKSGTTWLHASLQKSHYIFGSKVKELFFFKKPNFQDLADYYLKNFPETPGVRYYMESTPSYFQKPPGSEDIARNIKSFLEDPKIIVIFRNPIERYESAFIHHMIQGRIPYSKSIESFTDFQKMLTFGKYAEILLHWREIIPDIGVFFYDDIISDKFLFVERVMAYLDLENDIQPEALEFRTNDKARKVVRLKIDWPVMPTLSADLRQRLIEYYRDDISRLQEITGRRLDHWISPTQDGNGPRRP